MLPIINIAAYKFAPLSGLKVLREKLLTHCKAWGLKGSILLSTEGINLFVAGPEVEITLLLKELRTIPGLVELNPKFSESDAQPFSRMLVRIKKEIIAFGVEGIDPATFTSPKLQASVLKQWLDEGRPITLLDTRNDYEVKLGTFKGALPLGIDHFREFPDAVRRLPTEMKEQPIVMFCTGGIRCEKAGPFMQREGFQNVFQLDGGILKYFEQCGGEHYQGECFVFDQRVGVDPNLLETASDQCFVCLTPLTAEDQRDPRFVTAESCAYCFKTTEAHMAESIAKRQEAILKATTPLPGIEPYDNYRPISVPAEFDRKTLLDLLCGILRHITREEWLNLCAQGRLLNADRIAVASDQILHAGERYLYWLPGIVEPPVNMDIRLLHEDQAIIILNKPAPLPMHPCGRFNRHTLQYVLNKVFHPQKPRPAHRLDANTTGLVIVARTRHFAGFLQPQFSRGEIKKTYLARVQGHPAEDQFSVNAPISVDSGDLGSRTVDEGDGLPAQTEFRVLQRDIDGTSLLEAHPVTGRTNQIRVHLWQRGFPVCGDQTYLSHAEMGEIQTLSIQDPPLCLHAWKLAFKHPLTKQSVQFEAPIPPWILASTDSLLTTTFPVESDLAVGSS